MIFFLAKCGPQFFSKKHLLKKYHQWLAIGLVFRKNGSVLGIHFPKSKFAPSLCLRATVFIVVRKNVLIFLVRKFTLSYPFSGEKTFKYVNSYNGTHFL